MSEAGPNPKPAPERRLQFSLRSYLVAIALAVLALGAAYYGVRRTEARAARRYYEIALRFHSADSVNDQYLCEMSAELLEAELQVPFTDFKTAAQAHLDRIDAVRTDFVKQMPTYDRGGPQRLERIDELRQEARDWLATGKRPE